MTPPQIDGRNFTDTKNLALDSWQMEEFLTKGDIPSKYYMSSNFIACLASFADLDVTDESKEINRLKRIEEGIQRKREELYKQHVQKQIQKIDEFLQNNASYVGRVNGNNIVFWTRSNEDFVKQILKRSKKSMDIQDMYLAAKLHGRNPVSIGQSFYRLRNSGAIKQKRGTGENIQCYVK